MTVRIRRDRRKSISARRDELDNLVKEAKSLSVDVGWFKGHTYSDGTPIAYVAAIHEFGSPTTNIPPRPFMYPAVKNNSAKWTNTITSTIKGSMSLNNAFETLGAVASGDIAVSIKSVVNPLLKPATLAAKGFNKPLVDTGLLFQSVSHKVVKG